MKPVDKIAARNSALADLGLSPSASSDEIREAWRNIAFRAHPDHMPGDCEDFSRAKTAYDFLRKQGLGAKGASGPQMPKRPRLKKRVIELPSEDIAACKSMLNPTQALPHMAGSPSPRDADVEPAASDHVPDAVGCYGRHLTFFVATPVTEGANRIALPTSVLSNRRHVETEILSFKSNNAGPGEVVIPDTICERKFPGAKSVRIRFEADQHMIDEFWLAG